MSVDKLNALVVKGVIAGLENLAKGRGTITQSTSNDGVKIVFTPSGGERKREFTLRPGTGGVQDRLSQARTNLGLTQIGQPPRPHAEYQNRRGANGAPRF
jgi:hypothetical protein